MGVGSIVNDDTLPCFPSSICSARSTKKYSLFYMHPAHPSYIIVLNRCIGRGRTPIAVIVTSPSPGIIKASTTVTNMPPASVRPITFRTAIQTHFRQLHIIQCNTIQYIQSHLGCREARHVADRRHSSKPVA